MRENWLKRTVIDGKTVSGFNGNDLKNHPQHPLPFHLWNGIRRRYIHSQEEHHQSVSFDKEIDEFMKKNKWSKFKA